MILTNIKQIIARFCTKRAFCAALCVIVYVIKCLSLILYNIDNQNNSSINLDNNRLMYTNEKLDITIIEIKEKKVYIKYFNRKFFENPIIIGDFFEIICRKNTIIRFLGVFPR